VRETCTNCKQPHDKRRKVRLHFEVFGGMRVYCEEDGRKIFKAKCPSCKGQFRIDGGKDPDAA
jgi:hypothetical protein